MYAAPHDATESRDALAARHATDRPTLERVAAALHGQLGGRKVVALLVRERVNAAGEPMERRAYVPLHHIRAGAR
jgi:hypothetical protein